MSKYIVLMSAGNTDGNDHLTEEETAKVKSAAKKMIDAGIKPDLILTCFAIEATDSADIIAAEFQKNGWIATAMPNHHLVHGDLLNAFDRLDSEKTPVNTVIAISHPAPLCTISKTLTGTEFYPAFAEAREIDYSHKTWAEIREPVLHRRILDIQP